MPPYAGPPVPRSGDAAGTLRLLGWLALAIALIVLDHRGGWLSRMRAQVALAAQPLWRLAALPGEIGAEVQDGVATRAQLQRDNEVLRNALLISGARIARLQTAASDNVRLAGMLGAVRRENFDVQLVPILDVDLDPTHQRLVLDAGSRDGADVAATLGYFDQPHFVREFRGFTSVTPTQYAQRRSALPSHVGLPG